MAHHLPPDIQMVAGQLKPAYDLQYLRKALERDEGVRSSMYQDTTGNWTVGIGHNLSIPQNTFTIDALFQNDVNGCEASLDLHWPWWRQLDPGRQYVMMQMMFNLGSAGLAGFPKFLAAMQSQNWLEAGSEMLNSKWARQVGARETRLQQVVLTDILPPIQ